MYVFPSTNEKGKVLIFNDDRNFVKFSRGMEFSPTISHEESLEIKNCLHLGIASH